MFGRYKQTFMWATSTVFYANHCGAKSPWYINEAAFEQWRYNAESLVDLEVPAADLNKCGLEVYFVFLSGILDISCLLTRHVTRISDNGVSDRQGSNYELTIVVLCC